MWHAQNLERLEALMNALRIAIAALALTAAMRTGGTADAAEIRVLSSGSLKAALSQLLPDFQKSSGDTATIEYGPAGAIVGRVQNDDAADVVIVSRSQLQKLESNGKVVQGSLVDIAGIALGLAVHKGARRNRISAMSRRSNGPCSRPGRSGTAIRRPVQRPAFIQRACWNGSALHRI
jgi:ABC-type molybdate transport system substrate-binding protein